MSIWELLFNLTWVIWTAIPVLWIGMLAFLVYRNH